MLHGWHSRGNHTYRSNKRNKSTYSIRDYIGRTWLNPLHLTKRQLASLLIEAADYAHGMIIDIGCGDKPYQAVFSHRVSQYVGVDLPRPARRKKAADVWGNAMALPFKSNTVDTVLCTEVLEHVPEPSKCFQEISRVLKVGGHLIMTAPQTWGLHEEPYDFFRYTKYGLTHLARTSGLEVEYVKPECGPWATIGQRTSDLVGKYGPIAYPLCAIIQVFSLALDSLSKRGDTETLNNVMVARKL